MKIMSRTDAIISGEQIYNTGLPCVNGHLTYRYTTSGSCSQCVKNSSTKIREAINIISGKDERREFKNGLKLIIIRLMDADLPAIRELSLSLAKMRCRYVKERDVFSKQAGRSPADGAANYRFYVHPDDEMLLRNAGNALYEAHRPKIDIEALRRQAMLIGRVLAEVENPPRAMPDGVDSIRR